MKSVYESLHILSKDCNVCQVGIQSNLYCEKDSFTGLA
jgi:hypothetical protein